MRAEIVSRADWIQPSGDRHVHQSSQWSPPSLGDRR